MEFIVVFLSGLLGLVSPVNLVTERTALHAIRSRFDQVEHLQVRVDNAPSYQILQGKVNRFLMAGRGLWLTKDVRIDVLELETDSLDFDLSRLRQGNQRESFKSPPEVGVRLVLTQADTNQALQSPQVVAKLRQVLSASGAGGLIQGYDFVNTRVEFLNDNRLRFQVELQKPGNSQQIAVAFESGLGVIEGRSIQLINPVVNINGKQLPAPLVTAFTAGISRADLRKLENSGIIARILQLKVDSDRLEVATFLRFDRVAVP